MTKLELIKLINCIKEKNKLTKIKKLIYERGINLYEEDNYFPNIPELKNDFIILKREMKKLLKQLETKDKEFNEMTKNCNHEIRLVYYQLFGNSYKCPICNKNISDSDFDFTNKLRNHCVLLPNKYQYDSDDIKDGYTSYQVYDIIINILKEKKDNDEINLIEEFSKLDLKYCDIKNNNVKNELYILIIGGSNIESIDKYSYFTSTNNINSKDIYDYFKDTINIRLKYIDNEKVIGYRSSVRGDGTIAKEAYNSLEELTKILNAETIKYDLVIDATNLYKFKVENNNITTVNYDLDLKSIFKDSKIIKIKDFSKNKINDKNNGLVNRNDLNLYYSNKIFYSVENNELVKYDNNEACNKIKMLTKKRNSSS